MHLNQEAKLRLIWIQGVTCNGNIHSFLNLPSLPSLLSNIDMINHPFLECTHTLEEITSFQASCDVLIFEGAYDPLLKRNDVLVGDILKHYSKDAKYVISLGSCASFGGIFKASAPERNSGLIFNEKEEFGPLRESKTKVINLSGCPVHPEWLSYTLNMLINKKEIPLDELHRPLELYSNLAHHGCTRNEYFEWKIDTKGFGLKEGCMFYEQGCRAPMTHASCNKILWNEVSSKTRVGTPCFGCTEPDFPRSNLFSTKKNMSIPQDVPLEIPKRVYLTMTGMAKTFSIKRLEGKLIDYKTTR
ncbi:MAG: Ni,Fe-hydrogenase I small subunit [Sulfurimonas sp.]|jgi:Ni,Fe-hydrogenase I small subunit|uniref:NADH-quinone oxidoreductase subunit B family protein n=1 Tax=Sulfurimonas sp. TaxID=2022749 RepID=UPI0039E359FB